MNYLKKILLIAIALSAILMMNPYMIWTSYMPFANYMYQIYTILIVTAEFLYVISKNKANKRQIGAAFLLILYFAYSVVNSYNYTLILVLKIGLVFSQIILFCLLDQEDRRFVFNIFSILFALSIFMGIFYWILLRLQINIPYQTIDGESAEKISQGYYYKKYFGAVFLDNWERPNTLYRICGLYDEPGVVGTIGALLLIADKFNLSKPGNIILLLGGIFSFSFAFYCLIGLYFIFKFFVLDFQVDKKRLLALSIGICIFTSFSGIFLPKILKNDFVYEYVIWRFINLAQRHDNRTSVGFDQKFEQYIEGDDVTALLVGNGSGAVVNDEDMNGSNSYKMQLYDLGFIGVAFLYGILFYVAFLIKKGVKVNKSVVLLFLLFCVSTYQRIGVLTLYYFIILVGGIDNLCVKEKVKKKNSCLEY